MVILEDRYRGAMLGLAVGDAVGTTVEFRQRGSFAPVTDMVGGGPFDLQAGEWTDDTSMALCLAASLANCGGFDPQDQMSRYCDWADHGYMSSNGRCFDIGGTVSEALLRYRMHGDPFAGSTDPGTAGNGSLMRLAPVVLFYYPDHQKAVHYAGESSRTTHGAQQAIDACRIFAQMLLKSLDGESKSAVLSAVAPEGASERLSAIARSAYLDALSDQIRGSGYVVDALEAALWCFATTSSFDAAVLAAANLGDDADTTAAICGQIAGAYYGVLGIPEAWRQRVARAEEILELADRMKRSAT